MTALLVNLPCGHIEDDLRQAPGGLVSMATYAKQRGQDVSVCDLAGCRGQALPELVPKADLYGFCTYTSTYADAVSLAQALKRRSPESFVIAGGPHASALPEATALDFDCVVCGEGEEALSAILEAVRSGQRTGVPKIVRARPVQDLDALPLPDYEGTCDMARYTRRLFDLPVMCLDSSRGCDHRCAFCNSRVAERGHWRPRSARSVAQEVEGHVARGWRAFRFNDDNFLVDSLRARQICERLSPLGIRFTIFARADSLIDRGLCRALAAAGCARIGIGIESLSPAMLTRMGKATDVRRIREGVRCAHEAGIGIRAYFIVGFPGESDTTIQQSLDGLQDLPLDEALVYPCIAYPGTDLYHRPEHYGITFIDSDFSNYIQVGKNKSAGYVMRTRTFGPEQVAQWRQAYVDRLRGLGIAWADS